MLTDFQSSLIVTAPRQRHSAKPDDVYRALELLFGDVRRLDMFARKERPGWTAWGNEVVDFASAVARLNAARLFPAENPQRTKDGDG